MKTLVAIFGFATLLGGTLFLSDASADTVSAVEVGNPIVIGSCCFLTIVNSAFAVSGDGSAILGSIGIIFGATTFAVEWAADDSSSFIEIPAVLAIASGLASLLRDTLGRDASASKVSLEPAISRDWYGASLRIRF